MQRLFILSFLALLSAASTAEEQIESVPEASAPQPKQAIAEVNITYTLFTSLAEYAELIQTEETQHIDVNAKIVPVLEVVLQEYTQELQKYHSRLTRSTNQDLHLKINKLAEYAEEFRKELIFRKQNIELNNLLKKQQMIKQGK